MYTYITNFLSFSLGDKLSQQCSSTNPDDSRDLNQDLLEIQAKIKRIQSKALTSFSIPSALKYLFKELNILYNS